MRHQIIFLILVVPLIFTFNCELPQPGPPDAGLYHTYQEVAAELQSLQNQFPAISQLVNLGQSVEGRNIWAIKISDNASVEEDEPEILFVGGHHAREWIAVDVPFLLVKYLLENYQANSEIRQLIDNGEIWVVPMLNPDGHQYSVSANRLWRKNRRDNGDGTFGVDLNRNYSYQWGGPGSSGDSYSDIYRGTAAFSEPETQAIQNLANAHEFVAMISYHNYSQLVLFPWGYTYSAAPDEAQLSQLAVTMADSIFNVHGITYTPEQSSDLYLASGDATDWLYGETHVPAFTIEMRTRTSSPGFELPDDQIQPTFEENLPAALYLIKWAEDTSRMTTNM